VIVAGGRADIRKALAELVTAESLVGSAEISPPR